MVPDAERNVGALQAAENDSRVTRVGRLMRATAMDELPQLWSIFRGDMSFVGPRALRPGEIEATGDGRFEALEDVPGFEERHSVRPGLTGIAQIYAPRDIPRRNKFRYDRIYIRQPSLLARRPPDRPLVLDHLPRTVGTPRRQGLAQVLHARTQRRSRAG